jgi:hypothetical protein
LLGVQKDGLTGDVIRAKSQRLRKMPFFLFACAFARSARRRCSRIVRYPRSDSPSSALFEPDFCDQLVALYEHGQARDSGFMRNNVEIFDYSFKRHRDYFIDDEAIKDTIVKRISQCVIPEIRRLFFMKITRMECYLIRCYAAEEEAHFRPHRDNGQAITAHRRLALSVALNDDLDGEELLFPEYNQRPRRIAKGWCIVFPCAILHSVTRVTNGRRYVFLPFLYDEAGAEIKAQWHKQPAQALGQ